MADVNGTTYAPKLDKAMQDATQTWFDKMTKPELLQFIMDREDVTADMIRDMLKHEKVVLGFGVQYAVAEGKAQADFGVSQ